MTETELEKRLDPDQRQAVRIRENGAVSAGAGSGKTTVLAARYLDLVTRDGADVRSIVVLTFTRKAAAQMYGRIYRELLASPDLRAREQVDRFSEAQISTLDSFCSLILRPEAQEYGYPPDFRVDDEECRRIAETQALSFLLERREDPALREAFAHLGFESAWKDLFADAAFRLWTPAAAPDIPGMIRLQKRALAELVRAKVGIVQDAARRVADEAAAAAKLGLRAAEAASVLSSLPADLADRDAAGAAEALEGAASLSLQGFGRSDAEVRIKEAAKEAREAARWVPDAAEMEKRAPLTDRLLELLSELGERVRKARRLARVMSFRDVSATAVDLLARRPDVRAYWKRRFRFIMIDEFQDDDRLQKDLLYLLAEREGRGDPGVPDKGDLEPRKLFFVGDEKQSIYRFRGADVSVFRGLEAELGTGGPALRTNYRSEPALVEFFDRLFERVFEGAEEPYEARFAPTKPRAATPGLEASIRYLIKKRRPPRDREGFRSDDEALAHAIASFVRESVEGGKLRVPRTDDIPGGPTAWRHADYDDFAILLRSTSKQYLLEKHLRLLQVPYSSGDVCGLFTEAPANDIYQALRLAVFPEDGPAFAAFLRSPFVRLSDDGMVSVLALGLPAFAEGSETAAGLSKDDAARYGRGREILERVQGGADREPISALVRRLWYEEGLRLWLLRKPDAHPFLEHFEYIFRLAADADARCLPLASFVSELEALAGTTERLPDLDAPREAASGLRILTVHKAKGLEFPVVILPFLEGTGKSGGSGPAWYHSGEHGITLNLKAWDDPGARRVNVFYDMAREKEDAQEEAERKRLFYVACTRASAHLVFAASEPDSADRRRAAFHTLLAGGDGLRAEDTGRFPALPDSVLEAAVPDLTEAEYAKLFSGGKIRCIDDLLPSYESARVVERFWPRREISASAINVAWTELHESRGAPAPSGEDLPRLGFDDHSDRVSQTLFGQICHAAIQAELDETGDGRTALEDGLAQTPEELRAALAEEARRLAAGFLESGLGRAALSAETIRAEAPFLLSLEAGLSVSGRMDLAFRTADRVVVVDFKSDRRRREGEYDGQLSAYRAACRALYPGLPVQTWLFWLRSARAEERLGEPGEASLLTEAARKAAGSPGPSEAEASLR